MNKKIIETKYDTKYLIFEMKSALTKTVESYL